MYLSVVDALRCPAEHEESALVLSVDAWSGPRVLHGALGCPVCHARYVIADGIARFVDHDERKAGDWCPDDPERLVAQLGLGEPGGLVLLAGGYSRLASAVRNLADVTLLLIGHDGPPPEGCASVVAGDRLRLAVNTLRAIAVDSDEASWPDLLDSVLRSARAGARVVAPRTTPLPQRLRLIARDDQEWVAEVATEAGAIRLTRARRGSSLG